MRYFFLILVFLISGCYFPSIKGGKKEIAQIKELMDGKYVIENNIPSGWWIKIGDKEENVNLKDEFLSINIINKDNKRLLFYTSKGNKTISTNQKLKWFSGTFEELWSSMRICASSVGYVKYSIVIQFKNKDLKIAPPISVIASWGK